MIEVPLPKDWNKHHTLYYRQWYNSQPLTQDWRGSAAMIVPMRYVGKDNEHKKLHDNVPPISLPTDALVGYALRVCDELEHERITHLEAFRTVRDELYMLSRKRRRTMGAEALRFVDFFDKQLEYMSELPGL